MNIQPLAPREHQYAECVRDGLSDKQIARAMGIQPGTVEGIARRVRYKLCAKDRLECVLVAIREGFISLCLVIVSPCCGLLIVMSTQAVAMGPLLADIAADLLNDEQPDDPNNPERPAPRTGRAGRTTRSRNSRTSVGGQLAWLDDLTAGYASQLYQTYDLIDSTEERA